MRIVHKYVVSHENCIFNTATTMVFFFICFLLFIRLWGIRHAHAYHTIEIGWIVAFALRVVVSQFFFMVFYVSFRVFFFHFIFQTHLWNFAINIGMDDVPYNCYRFTWNVQLFKRTRSILRSRFRTRNEKDDFFYECYFFISLFYLLPLFISFSQSIWISSTTKNNNSFKFAVSSCLFVFMLIVCEKAFVYDIRCHTKM